MDILVHISYLCTDTEMGLSVPPSFILTLSFYCSKEISMPHKVAHQLGVLATKSDEQSSFLR